MGVLGKRSFVAALGSLAIGLLMAGTAQASLGTVEAKFIDRDPTGYTGGIFTFQRTANAANNTFAETLLPNSPAGVFYGICLELNESIASGSTHVWHVETVDKAPIDASGLPSLSGGMGLATAEMIAKLVTRALGGSLSNAFGLTETQQVALQMAVWEIVYETAATFDVTAGNIGVGFSSLGFGTAGGIPAYATDNAGAIAQANAWLTGLGAFAAASNLFALTKDGVQDFLVQTPLPAAAWLMISGLLGLFGIARRRKGAQSA